MTSFNPRLPDERSCRYRGDHGRRRGIAMTGEGRMAESVVALALACSLAWPHAHAARPATTRAEIQIGLCAAAGRYRAIVGAAPA